MSGQLSSAESIIVTFMQFEKGVTSLTIIYSGKSQTHNMLQLE